MFRFETSDVDDGGWARFYAIKAASVFAATAAIAGTIGWWAFSGNGSPDDLIDSNADSCRLFRAEVNTSSTLFNSLAQAQNNLKETKGGDRIIVQTKDGDLCSVFEPEPS